MTLVISLKLKFQVGQGFDLKLKLMSPLPSVSFLYKTQYYFLRNFNKYSQYEFYLKKILNFTQTQQQ